MWRRRPKPFWRDVSVGEQFGNRKTLESITLAEITHRAKLKCVCICGNVCAVHVVRLLSGESHSCAGCRPSSTITHGHTSSDHSQRAPEYHIWVGIKQRCLNDNNPDFNHYGGRGITMCERWLNSFTDFLADVGPRPSPRHSIDRWPDKNGNYEPGNVRWATQLQQTRNTRSNRLIEHEGKSLTASEWSEITGIPKGTIRARIAVYGWSVKSALTTSVNVQPRSAKKENNE